MKNLQKVTNQIRSSMAKKQSGIQKEFDKNVREENETKLKDAKNIKLQTPILKKDQDKSVRYLETKMGLDYQTKQSSPQKIKFFDTTESLEPSKTLEKFPNDQSGLDSARK